jgi:uncharacterized membrane protein
LSSTAAFAALTKVQDMKEDEQRTELPRARWSWLEAESATWVARDVIDDAARQRILESYQVQSAERRSLLALMLLGALMLGIGVLLLIGYNWQRVPVSGKVAIIMSSVALAFAASAWSYARQHRAAGETLALIGVLLFGNAIWLIAQVLHIRGSFSDAFMWWAIGALATAWLVRSRIVGAGAAVLVLVWVLAAGFTFDRPLWSFAAIWLATIAIVYALESPLMLAPAALSAIAWVCWAPARTQPELVSVGAAALTACACYGVGAWQGLSNRLGRAWQMTGLMALLGACVPLLISEFHTTTHNQRVSWDSLIVLIPALVTGLVAVAASMRRASRTSEVALSTADAFVMATALAVAVWLGLLAGGATQSRTWGYSATLTFSVLVLGASVALIHRALRDDRASDLTMGVLFAVVFLLVRWLSLIDSMLWSGSMLLLASAGFFAIAKLWSGRARRTPRRLEPAALGASR